MPRTLTLLLKDGDLALTQAASVTLNGAHGQFIENVHLETYASDEEFFEHLYPAYRKRLIGGASEFLAKTRTSASSPSDTMVFIR
jgi:histone deacetylase HOS3